MTTVFTIDVQDPGGVDTNLFFPATNAVQRGLSHASNGEYDISYFLYPNTAQVKNYKILYAGSNFAFTSTPDSYDISGNVISASLKSIGIQFETTLATLTIDSTDFPNGVPIPSAFELTPTGLLNLATNAGAVSLKINGFTGADRLSGSGYGDFLNGAGGADTMDGGAGGDRYYVDNAKDVVMEAAGEGSDYVLSSVSYGLKAGAEVERMSTTNTNGSAGIGLTGNEFSQRIDGNQSGNKLTGLGGNDTLYGYGGNDLLAGGAGKDALFGAAGNDAFLFDTALGSGNVDTITGFKSVTGDNDTFRLENAIFKALTTTGALNPAFFKANATGTATDSNDHILYETDTGKLFYDSNGSAAGGSVQFATLTGHPALTYQDFLVV